TLSLKSLWPLSRFTNRPHGREWEFPAPITEQQTFSILPSVSSALRRWLCDPPRTSSDSYEVGCPSAAMGGQGARYPPKTRWLSGGQRVVQRPPSRRSAGLQESNQVVTSVASEYRS